jgi:quinolinate synthase
VALDNPNVDFVRPCNLCPHMKRITLPSILRSLQTMTHEVTIDPAVASRARVAIQRMIDLPTRRAASYARRRAPHVLAVEARA